MTVVVLIAAPAGLRGQLLTRVGAAESKVVDLFDTVAPRLHGFAETPRFRF